MLVAAWAGRILADLAKAVNHEDTSDPPESVSLKAERSSQGAAGAKPSKLRTENTVYRDLADLDHAPQINQGVVSTSFLPSSAS